MTGIYWLHKLLVFGWILPWSVFGWSAPWSAQGYRADISPKNALVFFGETLKVQCKLESSSIQISDVHFKIHVNGTAWEVPEKNVTDADSRTKVAHIEVTESFIPQASIACYNSSQWLNSTYIYPEWPIKKISNFEGVYLFDDSVHLTWTLGAYVDPSYINVTVDYNPNSAPNQSGSNCSVLKQESCVIKNYAGQGILHFRIVVKAERTRPDSEFLTPISDSTSTFEDEFIPYDNLKTGVPTDFIVVDENSTCLTLRWTNPKYFQVSNSSRVFYHTDVKEHEQAEFHTKKDNAVASVSNNRTSVFLCNLTPFSVYKVRLRVKARDKNPWSDPVYTEGRTAEDVPISGPPFTDTSYTTKACKDNQREVTVYWNNPPVASVRGVLTKFEAVIGNNTKSIRQGFNYFTSIVDCHSASNISIYSVTKVGRGLIPSVVHIPEKDDTLFGPKDQLNVSIEERLSLLQSKTEKNITVRWNATDQMKESTLVFYMGQEAASGNDITFLYDYIVTETSANSQELTIEQVPMSLDMFGYALKHITGHTRGIEWIHCVYQLDKAPGKPEGVRAIPWQEANSLLITWTTLHCDKNEKVLISKFHLQICRQSNQYCVNVQVESKPGLDSNQYLARDLEAEHKYNVSLSSESLNGRMGPMSDPVTAIPKRQSGSDEPLLAILLPVFSCIIFLGAGFYICGKRFCKTKRFFDQMIKDTTDILPEESESESSQQFSTESGIGTNGSYTGMDIGHESPLLHGIPCDDSSSVSHGQSVLTTDASSVSVGINASETKNVEDVKGQSFHADSDDQILITSQMTDSNPEMIAQGIRDSNSLTTGDDRLNYIKPQWTNDSQTSKKSIFYGVERNQTQDEGYSSPPGLNDPPSFPSPQEIPPEELTQQKRVLQGDSSDITEYVPITLPSGCLDHQHHGRLNQDDEQSDDGEVVNTNDNKSSLLTAARDFLSNLDDNKRNNDRMKKIELNTLDDDIYVSRVPMLYPSESETDSSSAVDDNDPGDNVDP